MKIKEVSQITKEGSLPITIGKGPSARTVQIEVPPEEVSAQLNTPVKSTVHSDWWLYKNKVLMLDAYEHLDAEEIKLRIKHFILKKEKEFNKITKEIEAFERIAETETARREKIPDSVKLFVWQRDEGKCTSCGKKEKLEFDHIIPVVEGGSNTERNIQLLCETCNRSKGKNI